MRTFLGLRGRVVSTMVLFAGWAFAAAPAQALDADAAVPDAGAHDASVVDAGPAMSEGGASADGASDGAVDRDSSIVFGGGPQDADTPIAPPVEIDASFGEPFVTLPSTEEVNLAGGGCNCAVVAASGTPGLSRFGAIGAAVLGAIGVLSVSRRRARGRGKPDSR